MSVLMFALSDTSKSCSEPVEMCRWVDGSVPRVYVAVLPEANSLLMIFFFNSFLNIYSDIILCCFFSVFFLGGGGLCFCWFLSD